MCSQAFLVEFKPEISPELLEKILAISEWLRQNTVKEKLEVINTYCSLLVKYPTTIEDVYGEFKKLDHLISSAPSLRERAKVVFQIPVCYDTKFSLDAAQITARSGVKKEELIRLHSAPLYTVYFIGFLPGFLYMGGLDPRLSIPRRSQPRQRIEKGAVGIGENQTGIYPQASPGGWQIIGNSPVPLFRPDRMPPCEIAPGDKIKFYPVDLDTHARIAESVRTGTFQFKKETYHGNN